jgi:predicted nucleic acid-binding protein
MILVDTSVLVDYLKGLNNKGTQSLDYIIDTGIPYGINDYIYQELLQGSRTIDEYQKLKEYFETIPFYYLQFGKESFEKAAMINFKCRRSGITIRSTVDLLIAETAIENNLYLLQNDNDFINLSGVVPELKLYEKK